uniref:HTH_Tnp_Tc3_1 domain-containing protein n=1 Tax=Caenorhabditis japonica TaxID=281687 RepID=A0A8R1E7M1_CAEJA
MGRGKTLTMPERAQVDLMVELKMSVSLISARIHRCRTVIKSYISGPVAYGTSKSTGRPRKLKQRDERNVARAVPNTMKSAKDFDDPYNSTRAFLASKKIKVFDWPACSPDLNPIESVWGILARSVYKNGKQYNSISEFKNAVKAEWSKIQLSYLANLSNNNEKSYEEKIPVGASRKSVLAQQQCGVKLGPWRDNKQKTNLEGHF